MLHVKHFDTTLSVANPIEFCTKKEDNALRQVRQLYEGRCFKGSFIVAVTKIEKISACRIVTSNTKAGGAVDVVFTADVAVFAKWDVIPDVRIVKTDQVILGMAGAADAKEGARADRKEAKAAPRRGDPRDASCVVTLAPTDAAKALRVGQIVPVRILAVEHTPLAAMATAYGPVLTCDTVTPGTFHVARGSLDQRTAERLLPIVAAIDRLLEQRAASFKTNRNGVILFEKLLYAYDTGAAMPSAASDVKVESKHGSPTWVGPPGVGNAVDGKIVRVHIADAVKAAAAGGGYPMAGYWSRPLSIHRSAPIVEFSEDKPAAWGVTVVTPAADVIAMCLKAVLESLFAIQAMVDTYSSDAILKQHENVWAAMRAAQQKH
ncbi:MAG: RPB7/RPC8 family DNA-directed RNA polymerase subunit [Patescibacteria group bacterium]|nr:RPB7/RPC8 family DNA-directed RNA polymerase subunit [Patescibacteria group bacterium]